MIRFCQAADSNFGAAGLALYRSLQRVMPEDVDWAMHWFVVGEDLPKALMGVGHGMQIHQMDDEADRVPGLRAALESRDGAPWFWTLASQATHLVIEDHPDDVCVYLDTDCYFFSDPMPAIAEVEEGSADVGVVSHRFPEHRSHMWDRARYGVYFNAFLPTRRSRALAAWWAAMVRAQCDVEMPADDYLGIPAGRAGDQEALDAWHRFAVVHEIQHPGVGLAPYNWDGIRIGEADGRAIVVLDEQPAQPVVFAHMHEWRHRRDGTVEKRCGYPIPEAVEQTIVEPYESAVVRAAEELNI